MESIEKEQRKVFEKMMEYGLVPKREGDQIVLGGPMDFGKPPKRWKTMTKDEQGKWLLGQIEAKFGLTGGTVVSTPVAEKPVEKSYKNYVRFYKDGNVMAIETNHTEDKAFLRDAAAGLASLVESHRYEHDWEFQFQLWIPQIVDVSCKLRGYKSDVSIEQVVRAGDTLPTEGSLVLTQTDTAQYG